MSHIRLSVVVTIVEGEKALRSCLEALVGQNQSPIFEVIIPYDASIEWVALIAAEYPGCVFLPLGHVATERSLASPAGQHELFDRRRTAGLHKANGELVAIIEDRGIPDPEWAATIDRLHQFPYAAVGGAVECGVDRNLNWAVFFCDFGRYQVPFLAGPRNYLTDVNIAYKRSALLETYNLWETRYHETTVNWALLRRGKILFLTPELIVSQVRENLHLIPLLRERFHWGRLFAYTRVRESSFFKRLALVVSSPFLPIVLFVRLTLSQLHKRVHLGRFIRAVPIVVLLLSTWSLGEFVGYFTGKP